MTPAARVQAAIDVLDEMLGGMPAEQALTRWARRSRFAGSKDRAAVRDHVFDAWRCRRSLSAIGGAETGRGLMLGLLRRSGTDPETVFGAGPYAPLALDAAETAAGGPATGLAERLDMPDWLWPRFEASLGAAAPDAAASLQHRSSTHLRVNIGKGTPDAARESLALDGVDCVPHPASPTALQVTSGNRRIRQSAAYLEGLVELQDAASQALVDALPLEDGMRVLDFCAGGGGKSLAMAARARIEVFTHDADPGRMRDLGPRAARAGVTVIELASADLDRAGPFELVLCDVPCSGSGSWRRDPEGKWRLSEAQLQALAATQDAILRQAATLTAPAGCLAYATCSVLAEENESRIAGFFAAHPGWSCTLQRRWPVEDGTDGFFTAHLTRVVSGRYTT